VDHLDRTQLFSFVGAGSSFVAETLEVVFHADIGALLLGAKLLVILKYLELLSIHHHGLVCTHVEYPDLGPLCG
jgi:hypothetical protein